MDKKNNIKKWIKIILLIISFIPFILLLYIGIHGAINGVCDGLWTCDEKIYGLDAFLHTVGILIVALLSFFPPLVVCVIPCIGYQLYFIIDTIVKLVKKRKRK